MAQKARRVGHTACARGAASVRLAIFGPASLCSPSVGWPGSARCPGGGCQGRGGSACCGLRSAAGAACKSAGGREGGGGGGSQRVPGWPGPGHRADRAAMWPSVRAVGPLFTHSAYQLPAPFRQRSFPAARAAELVCRLHTGAVLLQQAVPSLRLKLTALSGCTTLATGHRYTRPAPREERPGPSGRVTVAACTHPGCNTVNCRFPQPACIGKPRHWQVLAGGVEESESANRYCLRTV
jgi:hypothetical protein